MGSDQKRRLAVGCRSRSEEHTSELQSQSNLVCRLLLEKKNIRDHDEENTLFSVILLFTSILGNNLMVALHVVMAFLHMFEITISSCHTDNFILYFVIPR